MAETLNRVVVEIDLGDDASSGFDAIGICGETMILRGDGNLTRFEVLDGLIATAMAKFKFEGATTEGVGDHLMAQADAKSRELGLSLIHI